MLPIRDGHEVGKECSCCFAHFPRVDARVDKELWVLHTSILQAAISLFNVVGTFHEKAHTGDGALWVEVCLLDAQECRVVPTSGQARRDVMPRSRSEFALPVILLLAVFNRRSEVLVGSAAARDVKNTMRAETHSEFFPRPEKSNSNYVNK